MSVRQPATDVCDLLKSSNRNHAIYSMSALLGGGCKMSTWLDSIITTAATICITSLPALIAGREYLILSASSHTSLKRWATYARNFGFRSMATFSCRSIFMSSSGLRPRPTLHTSCNASRSAPPFLFSKTSKKTLVSLGARRCFTGSRCLPLFTATLLIACGKGGAMT